MNYLYGDIGDYYGFKTHIVNFYLFDWFDFILPCPMIEDCLQCFKETDIYLN